MRGSRSKSRSLGFVTVALGDSWRSLVFSSVLWSSHHNAKEPVLASSCSLQPGRVGHGGQTALRTVSITRKGPCGDRREYRMPWGEGE